MQRRRHHCNQADSNSQLADSRTPPQRSHDQFLMSGTEPPGSGHAHVYASHRSEARKEQPEPREKVTFLPGAVGAGGGRVFPGRAWLVTSQVSVETTRLSVCVPSSRPFLILGQPWGSRRPLLSSVWILLAALLHYSTWPQVAEQV